MSIIIVQCLRYPGASVGCSFRQKNRPIYFTTYKKYGNISIVIE
jgi:hypothetical protein